MRTKYGSLALLNTKVAVQACKDPPLPVDADHRLHATCMPASAAVYIQSVCLPWRSSVIVPQRCNLACLGLKSMLLFGFRSLQCGQGPNLLEFCVYCMTLQVDNHD